MLAMREKLLWSVIALLGLALVACTPNHQPVLNPKLEGFRSLLRLQEEGNRLKCFG